jgi:anthranilate synthase component 1
MLMDLGRNDVGRVARTGSVKVSETMVVERYSHVMHIVSEVQGTLASDLDATDALRAAFPAGTLSGAPKVRAMEIIDGLEQRRRGIYGGAVGYFGPGGDADFSIAIRTLVARPNRFIVQAGAGIVADSVPQREAEETEHKARAVFRAVEWAVAGAGR